MNNTIPKPDTVFRGYRIATMVAPKTKLICAYSGKSLLDTETTKQPARAGYGYLERVTVGVRQGQIIWLARDRNCPEYDASVEVIDGQGALMTPGLIDCHTHLIYGGNRAAEWEMRLNGKSYEQIARDGGGILSTVRATRAASESELFDSAAARLQRLLDEGVTTVEIKSGYGLELKTELKMLRVAQQLENAFPVSVEPTFLGAHAVPPEYRGKEDDYVRLVCNTMIPEVRELCTSVDVFCESIAFSISQTSRVLKASIIAGLNRKIHAEQLTQSGAAAMAAEMQAISADHLEYMDPADCESLKYHGTVATLLPGAFYCLHETQRPPVAALRKHKVPIAIATDSNPGSSPVLSLLLMGNMACNLFGLTPAEALAGMTRNAAKALALGDRTGTIEPDRQADFAIWNVDSPAEIIYGIGHAPCIGVFKAGTSTRNKSRESS